MAVLDTVDTGNRIAGALAASMAALVALEAGAAGTRTADGVLVGVLVGTLVAIGLPASWALWRTNGFEARLLVAVLASLTLIGQLLVSTFGGPGGSGGRWDAVSVLVALAAVGVLTRLAAHARASRLAAGRSRRTGAEPPYAL